MKVNVTVELMKITPEIASEWIDSKFGEQRNIRAAHVSRLAADMDAGRWKISPDAIVRVKGELGNGQHRLAAVIKSGKPQTFLVMETNDENLYKVIDSGLRRTVADGLIGVQYSKNLPPIARWMLAYESKAVSRTTRHGGDTRVMTQTEVFDFCLGNKDLLIEAATFVVPLYSTMSLLPVSIGGGLYAIAASNNIPKENIKAFLKDVYIEGGNSAAGDLRNRLIVNRGSKAKLNHGYIFCIAIKAFRCYCNGTRLGTLKWVKDEPMPSIK